LAGTGYIPNNYVETTASIIQGTGTLDIRFWTDGKNNWTDDSLLAEQLGLKQVKLKLQYNQRIDDVMKQLDDQIGAANIYLSGDMLTATTTRIPEATRSDLTEEGAMQRIDDKTVQLSGFVDPSKQTTVVGNGGAAYFNAEALAAAINNNAKSQFWAMLDQTDSSQIYVFRKDGGDNNGLLACDVAAIDATSRRLQDSIQFEHVETSEWRQSGTTFSLGTNAADKWATMKPLQSQAHKGDESWNLTLNGRDVGDDRDLWITAAGELLVPGIDETIINGLDRYSFVQMQDAADGPWAGAALRTQSNAQEAIAALNDAITTKDKIRADLGAIQNRLENTMTNLEIQAENLQASESRISDEIGRAHV
jgi:flagellin-like hook-associated protein FlgL